MRKIPAYLGLFLINLFMVLSGSAQTTTITGNVHNGATKEVVPSASVLIKGATTGTFTDNKGNFRLVTSQKLPLTLIVSSIGYETQEIIVSNAGPVQVEFKAVSSLGTEVVISASRVPERILESPVSIERVSASAIRNSPASSYYDVLGNVKGVDITTSSFTFKTPSTRGFNGSGNVRFNQIVDGMDNQAPGLNFPLGNVIGLTELDVDNMELLEGASSALYGPGGMNGTLVVTGKDPFKYQGLSAMVKGGAMNINSPARSASPYWDVAMRWGQAINNRFAYKISAEYIEAKDWVAYDSSDYSIPLQSYKNPQGTRQTDPAYNGVNLYGDEYISQVPDMLTLSNGIIYLATQQYIVQFTQIVGRPPNQAEITSFLTSNPATAPFYAGVNSGIIKNQYVTRTGYKESDIIDPTTKNIKLSGALYYKFSDNVTGSLEAYWGTGNSVYTGSDRYALKDLQMGQYKIQFNGKNWFLRAFTTQENAGNAYNATVNTELLNEAWKPTVDPTSATTLAGSWLPQFIGAFVQASQGGAPEQVAYNIARGFADIGRPEAGSTQFNKLFDSISQKPIPQGGKFLDKSSLYMVEGQYDLTDAFKLKDKGTDILVGANWKQYVLNSEGTLFADSAGPIHINEIGAYAQISQVMFNKKFKLSVAGRYDKNDNFEGRFTPRITGVYTFAENQNIRLSFQSAYRFPTTQNQYINLRVGGNTILIGGLPDFRTYYHFDTNPVYTQASFNNAVAAGGDTTLLVQQQFGTYKPESMNSYEIGYKGLVLEKRLLIDAYGYYGEYTNLLTRINVVQSPNGTKTGVMISPHSFSISVNNPSTVYTYGYGLSLEYWLQNNYFINGNFYSDEINGVPAGFKAYFNTPKYRANLSVGNRGFGPQKKIGFNVVWHWQDAFFNQSDFIQGEVPAFSALDAQVSYKLLSIKSLIKLGATNLTNHYNINATGNPAIGGLYYMSIMYNVY